VYVFLYLYVVVVVDVDLVAVVCLYERTIVQAHDSDYDGV